MKRWVGLTKAERSKLAASGGKASRGKPISGAGGESEQPLGKDGILVGVKPGYKQTEAGVIPEEWEVVLSRDAGVGKSAIMKDDMAVSQHFIAWQCGPLLNNHFFYYWLQANKSEFQRIAMGNTIKTIGLPYFKKLFIPRPSKAEQEAIAEALSDADALIESLEQLIAKKRDLKQGAMQELFRPKNGWDVKKLEDIADVIDPHPSHRAPPVVTNGIPFLGIGDLTENGEVVGSKIRTVDPSVFDEHLTRYDLREELIGLGRVASIGKVVRLRFAGTKYAISPTLGVIKGRSVRRNYLLYALKSKSITDQFDRIMSGSTRSSVGMVVLRKLDVALPIEEAEQTAIATTLGDMDAEIEALEIKLAKTRQLKKGMMQELLTGRIRLV